MDFFPIINMESWRNDFEIIEKEWVMWKSSQKLIWKSILLWNEILRIFMWNIQECRKERESEKKSQSKDKRATTMWNRSFRANYFPNTLNIIELQFSFSKCILHLIINIYVLYTYRRVYNEIVNDSWKSISASKIYILIIAIIRTSQN